MRTGRSASARISPTPIDVSGTSAVGMHQRSSRSIPARRRRTWGAVPSPWGRRGDQRGRADLLEGVGIAVEGGLAERTERVAPSPRCIVNIARWILTSPLVVEDAQGGGRLPVGDPLVGREGVRQVDGPLHDRVVGLAQPVRRQLRRQVGDAQQQLHRLLLDIGQLGGQSCLGVTDGSALGHDQVRLVDVAGPAELADLLRQLVDPPAGVVALGRHDPGPLVERHGFVELHQDLGEPPPRNAALHTLQIGAEQPAVDHGPRVALDPLSLVSDCPDRPGVASARH